MMVAYGVTGTRIMAGGDEYLKWRQKIDKGEMVGPRLFVSGPILYGASFSEQGIIIQDNVRATQEVRRQKRAGYDFIKTHHTLAQGTHRFLSLEARRVNLPVVGHVPAQHVDESGLDLAQVLDRTGQIGEVIDARQEVVVAELARRRVQATHIDDRLRAREDAGFVQEVDQAVGG